MNKRAKGNKYERLAQKELEGTGWLVQRAQPSYRWNKQTDLFNLFDIIALKKDERIKFIQVKANRLPSKKDIELLNKFRYYCYFCFGQNKSECLQIGEVEWWCYWERGKRKNKHGWEKIIF
jgi:hypothetical protein